MARRLLESLKVDSAGHYTLPLSRALAGLTPATRRVLRTAAAEAERQGHAIYLVGGFVRDVLLGRPNLDLDLVIEGDAIALGRALTNKLGGSLLAHRTFGTAVWTLEPKSGLPEFIDLISARRESYARSGALPDVQFANIHDDQYRRDFSINTLALRLDGANAGQILDPWRGLADLRTKTLRTLHAQSFSDDPTRILRILRFAGRLKFKIEASTLAQLRANVQQLELISGERIFNELALTLGEPQRSVILQSMQRFDVLRAIQRGLEFNGRVAAALGRQAPAPKFWSLDASVADLDWVLWLAQISQTVVANIGKRLRFSAPLAAAAESVARLQAATGKLAALKTSALVARLDAEPRLAVYGLYLLNRGNKFGARLAKYAKTWRHMQPGVDGNDLQKLGLKPGPAYSRVLSALRAAWLDGEIKTKKQERELLRALIDEQH